MRRGRVRVAATLSLAGTILVSRACGMSSSHLELQIGYAKNVCDGRSIDFGLSLRRLPELYAQIIPWLHPLFGSALTLATVLAAALNLLLRVGVGKSGEAFSTTNEH